MAHQAKRPYNGSQPSIKSYFTSTSTPSYNSSITQSTTPTNEPCFPPVPANVQSNLINVGMRVRKSVPEGYKTGNYSAFALFSENNTSAPAAPSEKTQLKTRPRAGARELTPFCGILKVGGLAQQQWGIYNPGGSYQSHTNVYEEEMDETDEVPFLSSQGSTISTASVNTPTRENKRRFFEEDEDEGEDERKDYSSREFGERKLAAPKRKKWASKVAARAGQENVTVVGQDVDFEDAEFLDYGLVGEVEMTG